VPFDKLRAHQEPTASTCALSLSKGNLLRWVWIWRVVHTSVELLGDK
jgi:hypothetical protein